jgi:hypothetical protein
MVVPSEPILAISGLSLGTAAPGSSSPGALGAMFEPRVQVDGSKRYAWAGTPGSLWSPPMPQQRRSRRGRSRLSWSIRGEWGNSRTYLGLVSSARLGVALVINAMTRPPRHGCGQSTAPSADSPRPRRHLRKLPTSASRWCWFLCWLSCGRPCKQCG